MEVLLLTLINWLKIGQYYYRTVTQGVCESWGEKLSHAIQSFNLAVEGANCIDIGSSTGGFTIAYCNEERGESPVSMSGMGSFMRRSL